MKNKTLAILGLIIIGIALLGFLGTARAEWPVPFEPTDPSTAPEPPPEGGETTTPASISTPYTPPPMPTPTQTPTITYTVRPPEDFSVTASVKLVGVDGQVLEQNRIFAVVWQHEKGQASHFEIPFLIDLMKPEQDGFVAVGDADVDIYLFVYIYHDGLANVTLASFIDTIISSIRIDEGSFNYEYTPYGALPDTVVVKLSMSKHVTGQWGGTFYLVLDSFFDDAYKVLGDKAFGEWRFKFAMSVIVHAEKDLAKRSAWVGPVILNAEPITPTTTTNPSIPSPPPPPGPWPEPVPLVVTWEP